MKKIHLIAILLAAAALTAGFSRAGTDAKAAGGDCSACSECSAGCCHK